MEKDEDTVMEMQGTATGNDQKYGTEAGYSEDYGTVQPNTQPHIYPNPTDQADQGYGTLTSNTQEQPAAAGAGAASNPFTQQQYDSQKSSNPFKK